MRRTKFLPPAINIFLEPNLVVPFLIGTISVAIISMALYDFLKEVIDAHTFHGRYLLLAGGVFAILIGVAYWLEHALKEATHIISPRGSVAPQRKAVIVLGSEDSVVRKALEHHIPVIEHAWVIASDRDAEMAQRIKHDLAPRIKSMEVRKVFNPGDWYEASRIVRDIIDHRPKILLPRDFIVDVTGLTKPASIGAFLSALQTGAGIQYTPRKETVNPQGKTVAPLQPVQIEINLDAIAPSLPKHSTEAEVTP